MALVDITVCLSADVPTYPGNPPFELTAVQRIADGARSNVSALRLGTHTGTHVDAPRHFFDGRAGVDALPLDVLVGPARVVHLPGLEPVTAERLSGIDLTGVRRLLLRTGNSSLWNRREFVTGYSGVAADAAERIAAAGIVLVGVDYLSVERFREPGAPTHRALLGRGIVVVEGLDLSQVEAGDYELICLPLKLADADGSPARAILRTTTHDAR